MTNCPLSGRGQGRVTHSRISHPGNISGMGEARVVKVGCAVFITDDARMSSRVDIAIRYSLRVKYERASTHEQYIATTRCQNLDAVE